MDLTSDALRAPASHLHAPASQRFLVSTTHHLLAIDVETQQLRRVHSGSGLYYGLARDANGLLYVACRNSVIGSNVETFRATEVGSVLVLDRSFRVIRRLEPPFAMRDVHGILCLGDRLWVTCSFDNMVAVCDLSTGEWSRWFPAPSPDDRGRDIHHFNTVCEFGGEICLVAHRFGKSEVLFYDSSTLELNSAVSMGVEAHNVFLFGDTVATCSSRDGWLLNTDGRRLRTGNFPRGVAKTSEGNLLGLSVYCGRDRRASENGILRWYTPDWRFRADFVLPGVGMVLDIIPMAEQEQYWDALDNWPDVEITTGEYNTAAPGNSYAPNSFAACAASNAAEWHAADETHCWTAAKRAKLSILVNPGETRLHVEVASALPHPYSSEIWLNETFLGTVQFSAPGTQQQEFTIPPGVDGSSRLSFRVPHLWRPAEVISGSTDERLLGIAVYGVTINL